MLRWVRVSLFHVMEIHSTLATVVEDCLADSGDMIFLKWLERGSSGQAPRELLPDQSSDIMVMVPIFSDLPPPLVRAVDRVRWLFRQAASRVELRTTWTARSANNP